MIRKLYVPIAMLLLGVLCGGYLFSRSIPRSLLAISNCGESCYKPNDVVGLLASVGIQRLPGLIPTIESESTECLAVRHPRPEGRVHFVLFPKRDIRHILEVERMDQPFVFGCFELARELVQNEKISNYRLITNGPAIQHLTYLHFHLIAK